MTNYRMYSGEELAATYQTCLVAIQHGAKEKITGKFYYSLGLGFNNKKDAESKAMICRTVGFLARVKKNPISPLWNIWVRQKLSHHR